MKVLKYFSILVATALYLYISYVRFYHFIGETHLLSPYTTNTFTLDNPSAPNKETFKYLALGDSLSAGVGSSDVKSTFVYLNAVKFSSQYKNVTTLNLAQPGATSEDLINNQLPSVVENKPDQISLLIGTNDIHNKVSLDKFKENYAYILNELLSKTNAKITVINIPYLGANTLVYPPYNLLLDLRTKQFNGVIGGLKAVKNDRVELVDLYGKTVSMSRKKSSYYSSDLFHPSAEGYIQWNNIINAD